MADRELPPPSAGGKFRVGADQPSKGTAKTRALPPPVSKEGPPPDLGEGFPAEVRRAIEAGEHALVDLRENVHNWYLVGGACFMLRNVALNRSGANSPTGQRYNRTYATLSYAWPQLAKLEKSVRSHAIWLFENYDIVNTWLATLPQNQRDQWTHPRTIRRHYENRYLGLLRGKRPALKPRPNRHHREWNKQPVGDRSRADLEALIAEQAAAIAERDRTIVEMDELITAKDREIAQLRNDLAWEITARRQRDHVVTPPVSATDVRPDGKSILHAITRDSQEIAPDLRDSTADYPSWAKMVLRRIKELRATELHWLLADNACHFDEYERLFPGAGVALEDQIRAVMCDTETTS